MTDASKKTRIHTVYKTADGTRVPSVTTILGVLAKPALLDWAWKCGMEGLDYKAVRDQAGDIGTLAHEMIMCHLVGSLADTSDYSKEQIERAENAVLSFYSWLDRNKIEPVHVEHQMVSELHGYGGTCDLYGKLDRQWVLVDFKTSKAIYQEMFFQLAAYQQLLLEGGRPVQRAYILRVNKEANVDFEVREIANLDPYWEVFSHCLQIYKLQKGLR